MDILEYGRRMLRRYVRRLQGKPCAAPAEDDNRLVTLSPRVLLVVYDPVVDAASQQKLSQRLGWHSVEALVNTYIADLQECSGGTVRYRVVERLDRAEFPPKSDGFRYDAAAYFQKPEPPRAADWADYNQVIQDLGLLERVESGTVDEVWIFNMPYAGFYESTMAGRYALRCNSAPRPGTERCSRRFVIMGFSAERHTGQMLENFCHRAEDILGYIYQYARGDANLYARFTRYDQKDPGQAEVGTVHFGPNSLKDYDYDNPALVPSGCDDWLGFPNLTGARRPVNCEAWGRDPSTPDDPWLRPHHRWWLSRLPKAAGQTDGVANHWWKYIVDPNRV